MGNSILTSLMVSGIGTSGRVGTVRKQDNGDSFLGIFSEKLQESMNSGNKAQRTARGAGQEAAGTAARKVQGRDRQALAEKTLSGEKADGLSDRRAVSRASSSADEPEKFDRPEKKTLTDELASLLESLLMDLERLLAAWRSSEETTAEGSASLETANALEALQAIMDGNLEKLRELMERIQAMSKGSGQDGLLALMDDIETLISKLQQVETIRSTADAGLTAAETGGENLEALIAQLQSQCRQMAERLRNGQTCEASQELALEAAAGQESVSIQGAGTTDAGRMENQTPEKSERSDKADKAGADASGRTNGAGMETGTAENVQAPESSDYLPQNQQAVPAAQFQAERSNSVTEKSVFYLSDKQMGQTIINQVAMKVRLMAGENRQELEMQLKPESLGKLTLKIIHERGEILAKITAENEQVKSILESNMQLLKDALEKNGYSVQSLDVSVGNRNGENQAAQAQSHQKGSARRKGVKTSGTRSITGAVRPTPESTLYDLGMPGISQQIDLTA
ncbi:flagellar hook-length control protein FliK [Thermoclostridium caenicola]|uniref:Flagellar hook-length control protein FliK n=1 Tax=Thermoclostridium caenicola TaxID=659425 RepID=A0A1M6FYD4_9FIRM|nr:flagellar hook-length control protein FliK [Thermoclostridium caenicola]SHJ02703.1 Flagellar hook-length control protein FliK [Thermoclostridium caenicola]